MKKLIVGGVLALAIVILPHTAKASVLSDFVNWLRPAGTSSSGSTLLVSTNAATPHANDVYASSGVNKNELDKAHFLTFDLQAQGYDITVQDIKVSLSRVGRGSAQATTVYLFDGSTMISSAAFINGFANFSTIDMSIPRGYVKTLSLKIDIRNANNLISKMNVLVEAGGITAKDSNGKDVTKTGSSISYDMFVRNKGALITLLSKSISNSGSPQRNGLNNISTSTMTAQFAVRVKAVGGDILFGLTQSTTSPFFSSTTPFSWYDVGVVGPQIYYNGVRSNPGSYATSTSFSFGHECSIAGYTNSCVLKEGTETTVAITFSFLGRSATGPLSDGLCSVGINGFNWGGTSSTFMSGDPNWRTQEVFGECGPTRKDPQVSAITVISPKGGEVYTTGVTIPITWSSTNITGGVSLDIMSGDTTRMLLSQSFANNPGKYNFVIAKGTIPDKYVVRVRATNATGVSKPFEIIPCPASYTCTDPISTATTSITSDKSEITSGQTVKFNLTFPPNTTSANLYFDCPNAINMGTKPETCNTHVNVLSNTDWRAIFFNSTSQTSWVRVTYSIQTADGRSYSPSAQVIVRPASTQPSISIIPPNGGGTTNVPITISESSDVSFANLQVKTYDSDVNLQRVSIDLGISTTLWTKILKTLVLKAASGQIIATTDLDPTTVVLSNGHYVATLSGFSRNIPKGKTFLFQLNAYARDSFSGAQGTWTIGVPVNGVRIADANGLSQWGPATAWSTWLQTANSPYISAQLLSTTVDKAGIWNSFAPGTGNINKTSDDWNWALQFSSPTMNKEPKRITIISNIPGEIWSTGYSRYLADGTDLYNGREEHPYPLVVTDSTGYQYNKAYDTNLLMRPMNVNVANYTLYGQKENITFPGGKLIMEFTDGTSATTEIKGGGLATVAPTIMVTSPNGGEKLSGSISFYGTVNYPPKKLIAYFYAPDRGNVASQYLINPSSAGNFKGVFSGDPSIAVGQYKITVCDELTDNPLVPGKPLCDSSDAYFNVVASPSTSPTPTSSPTPNPQPSITVLSPTAGINQRNVDGTLNIRWTDSRGKGFAPSYIIGLANNYGKSNIATVSADRAGCAGGGTCVFSWNPQTFTSPTNNIISIYDVVNDPNANATAYSGNFSLANSPAITASATIDPNSLVTSSVTPTLTGYAYNITQPFGISIGNSGGKVWASGNIVVNNNRWSSTVTQNLTPGTYIVQVYSNNILITSGTLSVTSPTPSPSPSSSPSSSPSPSPSSSSSPSPSSSVHADASVSHNFIASVFYSIGDLLDSVF